jgi:UDP-glucose 4-epimerase
MKALVTGGNGFIGSHLVDALLASGWEVTVLDKLQRRYDPIPKGVRFIQGIVTDDYSLREAILGAEVVFHLAWTTIHEISNRDPVADIQENLIPTIRLLDACRFEYIKRVVFLSSGGTIYGAVDKQHVTENQPRKPVTSYGITKMAVEEYLRMYSHLYDLDYVILRPSVPYGPRQNPQGKQGAPTIFLNRIYYGLPLTIWGDGSTIRDYFYIEDLIQAMITAATHSLAGHRVFNVSGQEGVSLNDLIQKIETLVGKKAFVSYHQPRAFDAPVIQLDTRLIKDVLGWKLHYCLEEGLELTLHWIRSLPKPDGVGDLPIIHSK